MTYEEKQIDWPRVRHLLKLGIISAFLVLAGDMILGWGVCDPEVKEIPFLFTRYLSVSNGRIYAAALLGLIGIPLECFCWFSVYRMIQPYSEKDAHDYRAGILGCAVFGACGVHVPCCMAVYLLKRFYELDPASVYEEIVPLLIWFLLPATVIFMIFFFTTAFIQFRVFRKGHTPLPEWCCIFSLLFGIVWAIVMKLSGDHALTNALATGWISIGNLWMMGGLLAVIYKKEY